ncbi:restriction endonuclease subunit S [Leptospira licerasiae]|uniref:restriction endonuclease subunit S n=1 Tax=Leptospira licerasiae TaxID=447106 RepID=UPI0010846EC5|nr:restriction endonuclease subunit S [Leptospira licerasiae]TGM88670.1 restriction endonuclease subunit S [Leptospira licerasiae]
MSWNKVNLYQIAEVKNGYAFKSAEYQGHGIRVIRITNVQKGRIVDSDPKFISEINLNNHHEYMLYQNDILISLTGNVGRVAMFQDNLGPAVLNQRVGCIRVKKGKQIDPVYLFQFLNTSSFESTCIENSNGIAQLNLSSKYLENVEIPLPPLSEQVQIAEILTQAETLIAKRKESIRLLDELVKSQFLEMFGDPVKNEKGWEVNELEKLVDSNCPLTYGIVQPGDEYTDGIPVIRPVDLTEFGVKKDKLKRIDPDISSQFKRTILKGNEILMCVRGTTGIVSLATKELEGCNVTRGITPIWFSENYNSLFAYTLFQSDSFMNEIKKLTYGATLQQINLGDLRKMKLINPPLMLQGKFSQFFENIRVQRDLYHRGLIYLESLYSSLSQKAFRGELTFAKEAVGLSKSKLLRSDIAQETISHTKNRTAEKSKKPKINLISLNLEKEEKFFLKRKILGSYIINQSLEDSNLGDVKFEKLLHLCEYHILKRNFGQHYIQKVAGPYDNKFTINFFQQIERDRWFLRLKRDKQYFFEPGEKHDSSTKIYNYFTEEELSGIKGLIQLFRKTDFEKVEIVSTLFAVWNNRIIKGEPIVDELLKEDFLNWAPEKIKYKDRVDGALAWMREKGIVPDGWGPLIEKVG